MIPNIWPVVNIKFIDKDAEKIVGLLYRSKNYLTHSAMPYIYKSQIRPNVWADQRRMKVEVQVNASRISFSSFR